MDVWLRGLSWCRGQIFAFAFFIFRGCQGCGAEMVLEFGATGSEGETAKAHFGTHTHFSFARRLSALHGSAINDAPVTSPTLLRLPSA